MTNLRLMKWNDPEKYKRRTFRLWVLSYPLIICVCAPLSYLIFQHYPGNIFNRISGAGMAFMIMVWFVVKFADWAMVKKFGIIAEKEISERKVRAWKLAEDQLRDPVQKEKRKINTLFWLWFGILEPCVMVPLLLISSHFHWRMAIAAPLGFSLIFILCTYLAEPKKTKIKKD